jgi:hypothetical protein
MNKKGISMLWAATIQLALAAFIVFIVYQVSLQYVQGTTFEQDLQVTEQSLLLETITAKNTGTIQLHTFSNADYTTELSENELSIHPVGSTASRKERIHIPDGFTLNEQTISGRGVRWTRLGNIISLNELSY